MPCLWLSVTTRSASAGILPFGTFKVLRPLFAAFPKLALIAFSAWSRNDFHRWCANSCAKRLSESDLR